MMNPHEKIEGIRVLEAAIAQLQNTQTTTECADCESFDGGVCKRWGEQIPADTLPTGCDEWVFNPSSPPF